MEKHHIITTAGRKLSELVVFTLSSLVFLHFLYITSSKNKNYADGTCGLSFTDFKGNERAFLEFLNPDRYLPY